MIKRAKQLKLCIGCLDKDMKRGRVNPRVQPCKFCQGKHHHSLYPNKPNKQMVTQRGDEANTEQPTVTMSVATSKETILLTTIRMLLCSKDKGVIKMSSLLDHYSRKTFLGSKVYDMVNVQYQHKGKWCNIRVIVIDTLPKYHVPKGLTKLKAQLTQEVMKLIATVYCPTGELGMPKGGDNYCSFVHSGYRMVQGVRLLPPIYGFIFSSYYHSNNTVTNVEVVTVLRIVTNEVEDMGRRRKCPR